jgi:16S rRNA (adenine1518-N6/adenine1519-N6)-dimethyltransferase
MRPRKSLSQNFLIDDGAARRIVENLDLREDDTVLEIGAGKGALTRHLLESAREVFAVEIDRRLCSYLQGRFADQENLSIVNQDILKVDLSSLIGPEGACKVVGNLPYQITSPILSHLLGNRKLISLCVLMVQKEVALRICAVPGSRDWSSLSVGIQLHSDAETLFHLGPNSFSPPPRVESSVIRLAFLSEPRVPVADEKMFFKVVHSAFGQRRKMLINSLAANLDLLKKDVELILSDVRIDARRRAETLSIKEFADLSSALGDLLK